MTYPVERSRSIAELIRRVTSRELSEVWTGTPGKVLSYDAATRRCSVQPIMRRARIDESGEKQTIRQPVLTNVPVILPGDGSGTRIKWDVAVGTTVWIMFSFSAIDKWSALGGDDVDPLDYRRHAYTDCVVLPGLDAVPDVGDAAHQIEFTETTIDVGGTLPLAELADLQSLKSIFAAWIPVATTVADLAAEIKALVASWSPSGTTVTRGT